MSPIKAKPVKVKVKKETGEVVRTLQLRLRGEHPELDDLADRYQRAKRTTYGQASAKNPIDALKVDICKTFSLPSRIFSAIRDDLNGAAKGSQEKAKYDIGQVEAKLEKATRQQSKAVAELKKADISKKDRAKAETDFL